jgi:hypothetical protein
MTRPSWLPSEDEPRFNIERNHFLRLRSPVLRDHVFVIRYGLYLFPSLLSKKKHSIQPPSFQISSELYQVIGPAYTQLNTEQRGTNIHAEREIRTHEASVRAVHRNVQLKNPSNNTVSIYTGSTGVPRKTGPTHWLIYIFEKNET